MTADPPEDLKVHLMDAETRVTYRVAMLLLYLHWRGNGGPVKLANRGLGLDGVSRFAKWRSLAELELLDLVTVERRPRKSPLVTLRNL